MRLVERTPSSITMSPPPPITQDLLDDRRLEFMRLARAAQAEDGVGDTPIDVVIAHGVSREAFDALDEDLFTGLVVELRDDGTLVLVEVLSNAESGATNQISATANDYARENGAQNMRVFINGKIRTSRGGPNTFKPPIAILRPQADLRDPMVPLVVFLVGGDTPSVVRQAAAYFRAIPNLARVVWFKFFLDRTGVVNVELLRVPAMALAFQSGGQDGRVRVLAARSFGNAPVHDSVLRKLVNPPPNMPLVPFPLALQLNTTPRFADALRVGHVVEDLIEWERLHELDPLATPPAPMVVPMPFGLPPLEIPLFQIFVAAMEGWHEDAAMPL